MDNYTPDPFWNNQNQDSNESSDNSQRNYGSYTDDYSNDPNKEYTSYSDSENTQNSQSDNSDYNSYNAQNNSYDSQNNNYNSQNNGYNTGYSSNQNNAYNNQPTGYNNGYNNYNKPQNCPKFTPLLVFSIICIILFSRLFGIIALILLFSANNNFRYARYDKYDSCIKTCIIMLVISVVFGISWTVIVGIASSAFDAIR